MQKHWYSPQNIKAVFSIYQIQKFSRTKKKKQRKKKTQCSKILNYISQILLSGPFLGSSFLLILQGPEAVAAALAGCKILKEMARLESEAESARSMKEAKYEQFALGE